MPVAEASGWSVEEIADYTGHSLSAIYRALNATIEERQHFEARTHVAGPDITKAMLMAGR